MLITYFLACAGAIFLPWRFFSFAYLVGLTLQTIPDPEMARAYLPIGKVSILDVSLLLTLGKIEALHPKAMSALLGSPLARRVAVPHLRESYTVDIASPRSMKIVVGSVLSSGVAARAFVVCYPEYIAD